PNSAEISPGACYGCTIAATSGGLSKSHPAQETPVVNTPTAISSSELKRFLSGRRGAHLATFLPDAKPHVPPVWIAYDGSSGFATLTGDAQTVSTLQRDPRVAVSVATDDHPPKALVIEGKAMNMPGSDAESLVERIAALYLGSHEAAADYLRKNQHQP